MIMMYRNDLFLYDLDPSTYVYLESQLSCDIQFDI